MDRSWADLHCDPSGAFLLTWRRSLVSLNLSFCLLSCSSGSDLYVRPRAGGLTTASPSARYHWVHMSEKSFRVLSTYSSVRPGNRTGRAAFRGLGLLLVLHFLLLLPCTMTPPQAALGTVPLKAPANACRRRDLISYTEPPAVHLWW